METAGETLSRAQRAQRAKSIANEISVHKSAIGELQKKHGQFKRDHNRRADYDWKDNNARAERLNQIIVDSGLKRVEIAAHIGITPQHLSRVLRVKSAPLGKQLERRIEKAIANLKKRGSD